MSRLQAHLGGGLSGARVTTIFATGRVLKWPYVTDGSGAESERA